MKKYCLTCEYFGMCRVEQLKCEDWKPIEGKYISFDIISFTARWIKEHTRFYRHFKDNVELRKQLYKEKQEKLCQNN